MTARQAAYEALAAVTRDGAYTALSLKKHLPASLTGEDRRFATRLTLTTLENLIRLDFVLSRIHQIHPRAWHCAQHTSPGRVPIAADGR